MKKRVNQHLVCVIPSLGHGGAQNVLVNLITFIKSHHSEKNIDNLNDYQITIIVFKDKSTSFYDLPKHCNLIELSSSTTQTSSFKELIRLPAALRRHLKQLNPNLVLSFLDIANFPTLIACIGLEARVVISERQDPSHYRLAKIRSIARLLLYHLADTIVVQTDRIASQMPPFTHKKIKIIPNPIPSTGFIPNAVTRKEKKLFIIALGRLEKQKDFLLLLKALSIIKEDLGNWELEIYGEGSQRTELNKFIETSGLNKNATLFPATKSVMDKLATADLFILPSKFEGFPNVLAEAIAAGLPSIAFSDVSGANELIKDHYNGVLVRDNEHNAQSLADAILYLASNPKLRETMSMNCKKIAKMYTEETIMNKWSAVLSDIKS